MMAKSLKEELRPFCIPNTYARWRARHLSPQNNRRYHLGRGSACELRILDMKMSRQHCAFEYMDDAWQLIDLVAQTE